MRIFFDEDNGTGIPRALKLVRLPNAEIHYASNSDNQLVGKGTKDADWIPVVGARGFLLFSQNRTMLENEAERQLLIEHQVGAVFLATGRLRSFEVLRMLLNRWQWLELVDANIERPFAYIISASGRARPIDLT
ncbi:MAG: hypothetical protein ACKVT1_17380 [Dehalococcoidia bacterium]